MAVRIKDISEKLQLSPSTVSRVLNNKRDLNAKGVPYISAKTVDRVLKTAKEMGYRPNLTAKSLAMGKTMRIAFWVSVIKSRFFQEMACRFHDNLKPFGYEVILYEIDKDILSPTSPQGIARADVDGVIIFGGSLGDLGPILETHFFSEFAMVNMGISQYEGMLDFVQIDTYPATVEAMEHLVKTGRTRIAHVLCNYTKDDSDLRCRAYIDVLKKAGMNPEYLEVDTDAPHMASAQRSVREYIKTNGAPDALFCAEDELAIGAYRGIRDLGLKIPEDVAIIGFNGLAETEFFDPPISTIAQPIDEICAQAWKLLSRRMKKGDIPRQECSVKAKFLPRESSQGS